MLSVTIGSVEITALQDTPFILNPSFFLPEHADEFRAAYADKLDERGFLMNSVTVYVVRSGGRTVMVDTGVGGRKRRGFPAAHLPEAMREAGIAPEEIDVVVHSHLHTDHVGWNTVDGPSGRPEIYFPRAQFIVHRPEWEYWMTPERLAAESGAVLRECVQPLADADRVKLLDAETPIDEHLTFVPTPGHTPGHAAIGVYSEGERAVIIGDASHHPIQVVHPDWSSKVMDDDPELSAASRAKLFADAEADGRVVFAGHWEFPGAGRVVRLDSGRSFRAL